MATIIVKYKEVSITTIGNLVPIEKLRTGPGTLELKATCLKNYYPDPKVDNENLFKLETRIYEANNNWVRGQAGHGTPGNYILSDTIINKISLNEYNTCSDLFNVITKVYSYNEQNINEAKWYKIEWLINDSVLLKSTEILNYEPYTGGGWVSEDVWDSPGD